jgi:hypothetical protein
VGVITVACAATVLAACGSSERERAAPADDCSSRATFEPATAPYGAGWVLDGVRWVTAVRELKGTFNAELGVWGTKAILVIDGVPAEIGLRGREVASGNPVYFSYDTSGPITAAARNRADVRFAPDSRTVANATVAIPGALGFDTPGCYAVWVTLDGRDVGPFALRFTGPI